MLQTEYLRSLNSNYERILLEKKPEERKYQYCILSRGGIKGLLSCSLRYINGLAYLYYDISSKQNIVQRYDKRSMDRKWIIDFFWSLKEIRVELARFLLDEQNILWHPQQIFQDLENNIFSFLYVPYYEGNNGFQQLLEYFVEHIDYEDETLVDCIYKIYEQYEKMGEVYLQEQIFEDVKILESEPVSKQIEISVEQNEDKMPNEAATESEEKIMAEEILQMQHSNNQGVEKKEKKGLLSLFDGKKKKDKSTNEDYRRALQLTMSGYAVAEDTAFEEEEDWGRTIYVEETPSSKERIPRLCTPEGRLVAQLVKPTITIGKKKGEVDLVIEDISISRMHARIIKENEEIYLEDLNSTNGTFKNGLRMQPYEKRKLEEGDEIRFGKKNFVYG